MPHDKAHKRDFKATPLTLGVFKILGDLQHYAKKITPKLTEAQH